LPDAKTIQVRSSTKRRLDRLGGKGDTYDAIIRKLIVFFERRSKNNNFNNPPEKSHEQVQATRTRVAIASLGEATENE